MNGIVGALLLMTVPAVWLGWRRVLKTNPYPTDDDEGQP